MRSVWPTAISTEPLCAQLTPSSAIRARRERRHPIGVNVAQKRATVLDPLENNIGAIEPSRVASPSAYCCPILRLDGSKHEFVAILIRDGLLRATGLRPRALLCGRSAGLKRFSPPLGAPSALRDRVSRKNLIAALKGLVDRGFRRHPVLQHIKISNAEHMLGIDLGDCRVVGLVDRQGIRIGPPTPSRRASAQPFEDRGPQCILLVYVDDAISA